MDKRRISTAQKFEYKRPQNSAKTGSKGGATHTPKGQRPGLSTQVFSGKQMATKKPQQAKKNTTMASASQLNGTTVKKADDSWPGSRLEPHQPGTETPEVVDSHPALRKEYSHTESMELDPNIQSKGSLTNPSASARNPISGYAPQQYNKSLHQLDAGGKNRTRMQNLQNYDNNAMKVVYVSNSTVASKNYRQPATNSRPAKKYSRIEKPLSNQFRTPQSGNEFKMHRKPKSGEGLGEIQTSQYDQRSALEDGKGGIFSMPQPLEPATDPRAGNHTTRNSRANPAGMEAARISQQIMDARKESTKQQMASQRFISRNKTKGPSFLSQGKRSMDFSKNSGGASQPQYSSYKDCPSQVTSERLLKELQRGINSAHSQGLNSALGMRSVGVKPFSAAPHIEVTVKAHKKAQPAIPSQRSESATSSVYEKVLHSPGLGRARPANRADSLSGQVVTRRGQSYYLPDNCSVVADVVEAGIPVSLTGNQAKELVERLARRKTPDQPQEETAYSHRPKILDYSSSRERNDGVKVFDYLNQDGHKRQQKLEKKKEEQQRQQRIMQEMITRPNLKSDTMLAYKFRDEFVEAVNQLVPPPEVDASQKDTTFKMFTDNSMLPTDITATLSMNDFTKVLYCLGFIQTLDQNKLEQQSLVIQNVWDLLHRKNKQAVNEIYTQSLFNFLCFLMNLNNLVIMPDSSTYQGTSIMTSSQPEISQLGEDQHMYGNYVNDVFYVVPRRRVGGVGCQKLLIEDFYEILNNKKMYERQLRKEKSTSRTRSEMRRKETFRPALAPRTGKFVRSQERDSLTRSQYSSRLHQRSAEKRARVDRIREESIEKELENCTFEPRTNHKNVPVRVLYDWFCRGQDADVKHFKVSTLQKNGSCLSAREITASELSPSSRKSQTEQRRYVASNLYKPKVRTDRSPEEIDFEKNMGECSFQPTFYTKINRKARASPARGFQPKSQNQRMKTPAKGAKGGSSSAAHSPRRATNQRFENK